MVATTRNGFRYDFSVYDEDGRLVSAFEAKRRFGADAAWARAWREGVLEGRRPIDVPTFLVLPDRLYGWKPMAPLSAEPDLAFDAEPILAPYFKRIEILPSAVDPTIFESIVEMWLSELARGDVQGGAEIDGALGVVRGCEVVHNVRA